ncbi:hypothetical protein S7335_1304 [Synechococcus sp. PCC 7335]|nr:hypothetical protein S7335_1190 [Synechococcus sp. PCC 7335]EDX82600.1 hypothetical protein S7335_1304 [Synechococcus sp. PCC 7335]
MIAAGSMKAVRLGLSLKSRVLPAACAFLSARSLLLLLPVTT